MAGGAGRPGRGSGAAARSPVRAMGSPPRSPMPGYLLNGVSAVSAASAWAAGMSAEAALHVARWDGQNWQPVPAPGTGDFSP